MAYPTPVDCSAYEDWLVVNGVANNVAFNESNYADDFLATLAAHPFALSYFHPGRGPVEIENVHTFITLHTGQLLALVLPRLGDGTCTIVHFESLNDLAKTEARNAKAKIVFESKSFRNH